MADVELTAVTKRFRTVTAIDRMDLAVNDGEFFVLLGPTGARKTTRCTRESFPSTERPEPQHHFK
jgi:ABC-type sugar transport system ATPase subunit